MTGAKSKYRNGRPAVEWIVGVNSAAVVCAILLFLSYEALFGDMRPPDLVAALDRIQKVENGTLVIVTLSNRGDQAAADITVEATAERHGDRKEIRFDYVAAHAARQGAFVIEGS